jgi:hypothetical protein
VKFRGIRSGLLHGPNVGKQGVHGHG